MSDQFNQPDSPGEIVARALQTTGIVAEPLHRLDLEDPADSAELANAIGHLCEAHSSLGRLAGRLFTAEHPVTSEQESTL